MKSQSVPLSHLKKTVAEFENAFESALKRPGEQAVHSLRVESRRLSILYKVALQLKDDAKMRLARKTLKKLREDLSELRDVQVQKRHRDKLSRKAALCLSLHEKELQTRVSSRLERRKLTRITQAARLVQRVFHKRSKKEFYAATNALLLRYQLDLEKHPTDKNLAELHHHRIDIRKLRYLLELYPHLPLVEIQLKALRLAQDRLGRIHDLYVFSGDATSFAPTKLP